jgi:glycosyltransferase involved in cell wall biosynthesis
LRALYSAADVIVVPSLQENLSNVIMESLSCGTPVVAFDVGGNKDMILNRQNGYLATPFNPADLSRGIAWVIKHPSPEELSANARKKVVDCFEMTSVARQYHELYKVVFHDH